MTLTRLIGDIHGAVNDYRAYAIDKFEGPVVQIGDFGIGFGRYMALKSYVVNAVTATIDSLIEDGYLKTRGTGANMVILKHTEWCKKSVDN